MNTRTLTPIVKLTADDESLMAMQAAQMKLPSIAATMGWTERRVAQRLERLAAALVKQEVAERDWPDTGFGKVRFDPVRPPIWSLAPLAAALPAMAGVLGGRGLAAVFRGLPVIGSMLAVQGMARLVEAISRLEAATGEDAASRAVDAVRKMVTGPGHRPGASSPAPWVAPTPAVAVGYHWSEGEDTLLRRTLADGRRDPIGRASRDTGRTEQAVRARMQKLGLATPGHADVVPTLDSPPRPPAVRRTPRLVAMGERQGVETLKAVTPARLRFARWFHRADWPVEEIAALFDLPAGELAQALGAVH